MSSHAYPPNAGVFETPIPDMLLRSQERAQRAEARAERWDLAGCALERHLSLELARGNRLISTGAVLDLLGSMGMFGESGIRSRAIGDVLDDLQAELNGGRGRG